MAEFQLKKQQQQKEVLEKQQQTTTTIPFMPDPRKKYSQVIPPGLHQDYPGLEYYMDPAPDYGEKTYRGNDKLQGMVALVTGGDSGIGRAVCLAYAREGADIAFTYLDAVEAADARQTQAIVEAEGRKCVMIACDLSNEKDCSEIVKATVKSFGRIDILVNNAAYQGPPIKELKELEPTRIIHTFNVNLIAPMLIVNAAIEFMQPGSSIINTASNISYTNEEAGQLLDYATSKSAIIAFTKGLSAMLLKSKGIRVNCVVPGLVWTPLVIQSCPDAKLQKFGQNNPLGRPAQPAEIAPAYVYLASPNDASYVSGEALNVTGGLFTP
jgi:NAD(P)-dependent dehydrogenase (short-subunit alcohol dehydrogenase family)